MRILRLAAIPVILLTGWHSPAAALELLDRVIDFTEKRFVQKRSSRDGPPPFRVGLMLPADGEFTEAADRIARGWEIAAALSDGIVAQRQIEIIRGDTGNRPAMAVDTALRMMKKENVDVFAGILSARVARAMMQFADRADRPIVIAGAIGETVMTGRCSPRVVRTSFNVAPYADTAARFLARQHGTAVTLAPDAPGGHRLIQRFSDSYRAAGGQIVEQLWAPRGRKYDWSSWLTRSSVGGPEMIYAIFEGRNSERLVYRYSRTGLKRQLALVGPEWMFGPRTLGRRGKHASGLRFLTAYLPSVETTANRLFADAYREIYDEDPDMYAYLGYENALTVLLTAAELEGRTGDAAKFISTLKALNYTGLMPRGPFSFNRANSAALSRFYWVEVHHRDDDTWLKKLDEIPIDADKSACRLDQASKGGKP